MRAARLLSSVAAALLAAGCAGMGMVEVPVETPIRPKIDASPFARVYVAGFVSGGSEDVDTNLETVRLLRSQLKNKANMRVIEADVLPLMDVAKTAAADAAAGAPPATGDKAGPLVIRDEKDIQPFEKVFEDKDYWKKVGQEYQGPLIVTGSVIFVPHQRSGYVQKEQEEYDSFGRRSVVPVRTYMDRKGYILEAQVRLHRRPHGGNALLRDVPRGDPLQRRAEHAGPVVVLRADGPAPALVPGHAQQPDHQGHPGPAQVGPAGPSAARGLAPGWPGIPVFW